MANVKQAAAAEKPDKATSEGGQTLGRAGFMAQAVAILDRLDRSPDRAGAFEAIE